MKLLHNRGVLAGGGLVVHDETTYGFDTSQFDFAPLSDTFSSLASYVHGNIDDFFNERAFDFYLALKLDFTMTSGLFNNQNYLNRNDNSTGSDWYGRIKLAVGSFFNNTTGTQYWSSWSNRFKGIRWNHEYRLGTWDRGTTWWNWASSNTGGLGDDVHTNYLTEWNSALGSIQNGQLLAYDFAKNVGGATVSPWNGVQYNKPKQLFNDYFGPYMCNREATIIGHLSDVLSEVGSGLKLILYPPSTVVNTSPHAYPPWEYSLDANLVNKSNIVWEVGGQGAPITGADDAAWIAEAASSAGTHNFYCILHQDPTTLPSPLSRVGSTVQRRLDATNAAGATAWDSKSFGLWTQWPNVANPMSTANEGSYMDEVKDKLT